MRFGGLKPCAVILMLLTLVACGGEHEFVQLPLDGALAQGKQKNKLVMAVLAPAGDPVAAKLDAETWADPGVQRFLARRAISVRVDTSQPPDVTFAYNIVTQPAIVFFDPDGRERDRFVGFIGPEAFLTQTREMLDDEDMVVSERREMNDGYQHEPYTRMYFADTLVADERYAEALDHFMWLLNEGVAQDPDYRESRTEYLYFDLKSMLEDYPEGRERCVAERDRRVALLLSDEPVSGTLMRNRARSLGGMVAGMFSNPDTGITKLELLVEEVIGLNKTLDETQRSIELYRQLLERGKETPKAREFNRRIFATLVEEREYALADELCDIGANFQHMMDTYKAHREEAASSGEYYWEYEHQDTLTGAAQCVEIELALDRPERAWQMADEVLAIKRDAYVLNELAWAAFMAGKADEHAVALALEATEMSQWKDEGILDTYVRLLAQMGRTEEAKTALDKGMRAMPEDERWWLDDLKEELEQGHAGDHKQYDQSYGW